MGIREHYARGVFNWVDLMTTDPKAAQAFYGELLGWTFMDVPMPNGELYAIAQKEGRDVAAILAEPAELLAQGIPPHWQSYLNAPDLEETVAACLAHGGTVCMEPHEVMDVGRMATIQDPTGAVVALWEAKTFIGAGIVNEPQTLCWNELQTWDAKVAADFYSAIFGWEIEVDEKPPHYTTTKVDGKYNGGIFDMSQTQLPRSLPSNWAVYFNVADLDGAIAKAKALGGTPLMEPISTDAGRFTTIRDPQGATVALIQAIAWDD